MHTEPIHGKKAWKVSGESVQFCVTETGGMMAPVEFLFGDGRRVAPYYISPWQEEDLSVDAPVLEALRGDFFCLPFGGPSRVADESFEAHGEPAYSQWSFEELTEGAGAVTLRLAMETTARPGRIEKRIAVRRGSQALYIEHRVEGMAGRVTLGHHATLDAGRTLLIATSPFRFGITAPAPEAHSVDGEYYALPSLTPFSDLASVPTRWKDPATTDCSVFPNRRGFVDIISVSQRPTSRPAWTTAVCPEGGYLWYSLKDVAVLPSTVMWMENHGRHASPWLGRNCCIGLEEVCAFAAEGLAASIGANPVSDQGIPTTVELDPSRPFTVRNIQGCVAVPEDFGRVVDVDFAPGAVMFRESSGREARAAVDWSFVLGGPGEDV